MWSDKAYEHVKPVTNTYRMGFVPMPRPPPDGAGSYSARTASPSKDGADLAEGFLAPLAASAILAAESDVGRSRHVSTAEAGDGRHAAAIVTSVARRAWLSAEATKRTQDCSDP